MPSFLSFGLADSIANFSSMPAVTSCGKVEQKYWRFLSQLRIVSRNSAQICLKLLWKPLYQGWTRKLQTNRLHQLLQQLQIHPQYRQLTSYLLVRQGVSVAIVTCDLILVSTFRRCRPNPAHRPSSRYTNPLCDPFPPSTPCFFLLLFLHPSLSSCHPSPFQRRNQEIHLEEAHRSHQRSEQTRMVGGEGGQRRFVGDERQWYA